MWFKHTGGLDWNINTCWTQTQLKERLRVVGLSHQCKPHNLSLWDSWVWSDCDIKTEDHSTWLSTRRTTPHGKGGRNEAWQGREKWSIEVAANNFFSPWSHRQGTTRAIVPNRTGDPCQYGQEREIPTKLIFFIWLKYEDRFTFPYFSHYSQ